MQLEQHGQEHRLHPVRRVQLLRSRAGALVFWVSGPWSMWAGGEIRRGRVRICRNGNERYSDFLL